MKLKEKLEKETGQRINLYKQGVFWTAYEQSALILSRHKQLKISIKFVKTVNQEVLSVGFPDTTLVFFNEIFGRFTETEKHIGYFELNDKDTKMDLGALREKILNKKVDAGKPKQPKELADLILAFRLTDKTPLDAMVFVKELQEKIRQDK